MTAAVRITRTEHTAAELRALATRSREPAQSRRLLSIAMVLDGCSRFEAARQTGMDRQSLRDWVHRYNEALVLEPDLEPGSARRAPMPTFGELLAHARPWCGIIVMTRSTCSARSALRVGWGLG